MDADEQIPDLPLPGKHKTSGAARSRAVMVFGTVLTCVGLLAAVTFQVRDDEKVRVAAVQETTASSQLEQTVRAIQKSWAAGVSSDEVGLLRVPRFDRPGAPFVAPVVEGWGDSDLARGVGLYLAGDRPGERGNVVLAGHRVTHGSVFADLPSLEVGDEVTVETTTSVLTYRLITSGTHYRVDDTVAWPTWTTPAPDAEPNQPTKKRYLTLVTCAETFHTEKRNVAIAVQIDERPRDPMAATSASRSGP